MREVILLTGASGLVGSELLARLARRRIRIIATEHSTPLALTSGKAAIETVRCDLRRPRLGLSEPAFRTLAREVTSIVHCAGSAEFGATRDQARTANVQPVEQMLDFARAAPKLSSFVLLSTTYVAGRRTGAILERELTHRRGFVNEYERSKYEAEQLVRHAMSAIPISVLRLSTILSSRNGAFRRMGAVHQALRLYHAGLLPMVPGTGESPVDLITTEFAADSAVALLDAFRPGATHHIAAGASGSLPLRTFLMATQQGFATGDRAWAARGIEPPPIVGLATFRRLRRSIHLSRDPVMTSVVDAMNLFAPQLAFPKIFDDGETRAILRRSGVREETLGSFYPRFIRAALRSRWGKLDQTQR